MLLGGWVGGGLVIPKHSLVGREGFSGQREPAGRGAGPGSWKSGLGAPKDRGEEIGVEGFTGPANSQTQLKCHLLYFSSPRQA